MILGPSQVALTDFDRLTALTDAEVITATTAALADPASASHVSLELSRTASQSMRRGQLAMVTLDMHCGATASLDMDARQFICRQLSRVVLGLADQPDYLSLYCEKLARGLVIESLGHQTVPVVAKRVDGTEIWQLPSTSSYPGMLVAAVPEPSSAQNVADVVAWFRNQTLPWADPNPQQDRSSRLS